jgi:hypothetical protein
MTGLKSGAIRCDPTTSYGHDAPCNREVRGSIPLAGSYSKFVGLDPWLECSAYPEPA